MGYIFENQPYSDDYFDPLGSFHELIDNSQTYYVAYAVRRKFDSDTRISLDFLTLPVQQNKGLT